MTLRSGRKEVHCGVCLFWDKLEERRSRRITIEETWFNNLSDTNSDTDTDTGTNSDTDPNIDTHTHTGTGVGTDSDIIILFHLDAAFATEPVTHPALPCSGIQSSLFVDLRGVDLPLWGVTSLP